MYFSKPRNLTQKTSPQSILAVTHPFLPLPSYEIRCRQFVEMVNGTDSEVRCFSARSPRSQDSYPGSPSLSPRHGSSNSHVHSTGKCGVFISWWEEQMLKVNYCPLPAIFCMLFYEMLLSFVIPSWESILLPWVSLLSQNGVCINYFPQTNVCWAHFFQNKEAF